MMIAAEIFTRFPRMLCVKAAVALALLCGLFPSRSISATVADARRLPEAGGQLPLFQKYRGRELRAGESYADPATGVRVTKLTDANTPAANENGLHHYSSGPVQVSREWGTGFHTINLAAAG